MLKMDNIDIFVSTTDTISLASFFSIARAYTDEANLTFKPKGMSMKFCTNDDYAMINFDVPEEQLLGYVYRLQEEERFFGINLKKCHGVLRSIPVKTIGNIIKSSADDNFYANPEGSFNREASNRIQTINLEVDIRDPPVVDPSYKYIKVPATDFASVCSSFNKQGCVRVRFVIVGSTLLIRGYDEDHICQASRSFRNIPLATEEEEEAIDFEDESNITTIRKGKLKITVHKKNSQQMVETTIDKLIPLAKINNLCRSGLVYVYICKVANDKNLLMLKTNVGQIGTFSIYLRDTH